MGLYAAEVDVGTSKGSELGPVVCGLLKPVADVIVHHSIKYHQYADDTTRNPISLCTPTTQPLSCPFSLLQYVITIHQCYRQTRQINNVMPLA